MSNKDTHDLIVDAFGPSQCRVCRRSGAELVAFACNPKTAPQANTDELREQIRKILHAPMRSEVSTADIAVGMMSSTMVDEKVFDLEKLTQRIALEARIDEYHHHTMLRRYNTDYRIDVKDMDARLSELKSQLSELEK